MKSDSEKIDAMKMAMAQAKAEMYESRYTQEEQAHALEVQKVREAQMNLSTKPAYHSIPHIPPTYKFQMGNGAFFNHSANRLVGKVVAQTSNLHGNGFWSEVQVTEDDYVRFKLYRGGWFSKALFMLGKEPRDDEGKKQEWDSIGNQRAEPDNLEVMLGKTYLKIDEIIAEELDGEEHRKFIKDMTKTDPENLKMIAGLKNLHDGMEEGSDKVPELNGSSGAITAAKVTSKSIIHKYDDQMNLVGSGTFTGNDSMKLDNSAQEVIRIDPNGDVFHAKDYDRLNPDDSMEIAKAIRNATAKQERYESDNPNSVGLGDGSTP